MKVSIIIPVFNKWELTKDCLESLRTTVPSGLAEVIVIDNASSDETATTLPTAFPEVRYERQETNTGFAGGNNIGARLAHGELLMLLNNDTVTQAAWLEPLIELFDTNPRLGVAGSKLLYADGHIQHAGLAFNGRQDPFHLYRNAPSDFVGVNKRRRMAAVTGACFMVRREQYLSMGGLCEDYRNGFEDLDFCLQIGTQGLEVWYEPKSCIYHLESQTPGRKRFDKENHALFSGRWRKNSAPDAEEYYRQDGFSPVHFPYIERMTQITEAEQYLPRRWEIGRETSPRLRAWAERLQKECVLPVELVDSDLPRGLYGQVRPDYRYLTYRMGVVEEPGTDVDCAGLLVLRADGQVEGIDRQGGRSVTFPAHLNPSMVAQLFSFNLQCNHPRGICEAGLRQVRRGSVEGDVYAREFATLWPSDVESCRFDTELALHQGDSAGALKRLETFYANDHYNAYVTLKLAEVLIRVRHNDQARTVLSEFLRERPVYLRARWLQLKALTRA